MSGSLVLKISYGIDAESENDPLIYIAEKAVDSLTSIGNAGAYLGMFSGSTSIIKLMIDTVDSLPICKQQL